jgi:hypothetical protein
VTFFIGALLFHVCEKQHMCHRKIASKCGLPLDKAPDRAAQIGPNERVRNSQRQKVATKRPLYRDSIAAMFMHRVTLAESQILSPAGELGLLVDQVRGGASRAAGQKSGAESYGKNDRCNIHGISFH